MKKRLIVFSALTIFILLSLAIGFLRQKIAYVEKSMVKLNIILDLNQLLCL